MKTRSCTRLERRSGRRGKEYGETEGGGPLIMMACCVVTGAMSLLPSSQYVLVLYGPWGIGISASLSLRSETASER